MTARDKRIARWRLMLLQEECAELYRMHRYHIRHKHKSLATSYQAMAAMRYRWLQQEIAVARNMGLI